MPEPHSLSSRVRYRARWVVPVATPPIADGTVITEGARIAWVGPSAHSPAGGRDEPLGDAILTPGLVNAHTHLDLTMMRGVLDGLSFFEWVRTLTQALREVLSEDDRRDAALLGVAEGLAAGITCFGDTAASDAPFDALRILGARGIAYREVFGPDPTQCPASLNELKSAVSAMRARATPLVRVGVSPHAPYSVSDSLFRAVGEWAAREALPLAVHIAESEAEEALVTRGAGPFALFLRSRGIAVESRATRPIELLRAAGLLRPGALLIHCVRAQREDVQRIADGGCGVAHCPASNAKLGHGIAPLAELLAAGARVGLGSDSMASNDVMDLLAEARLAASQQNARPGHADAISAGAAFRLATLGGAEALRLDDEVGSLEIGKQADLAVFESDANSVPIDDPYAALVFTAGRLRVARVIVAGQDRLQGGEVLGFDPAIRQRVDLAAVRLAQWRRARPSLD